MVGKRKVKKKAKPTTLFTDVAAVVVACEVVVAAGYYADSTAGHVLEDLLNATKKEKYVKLTMLHFTMIYCTYVLQPSVSTAFNQHWISRSNSNRQRATTTYKGQIDTYYSISFQKAEHKFPANMAR